MRRLGSIENVFLWAAKKGRDKKFEETALAIVQFDANVSIDVFAKEIIDKTFSEIQKINPEVMRFFESRYTKMKGLTPDYFSYTDCLVEPYLEAASKNQTNTFRQISKNEATLLLKQLCFLVERPFMEDSPIAGTEEHRKITQEAIVRLLGK